MKNISGPEKPKSFISDFRLNTRPIRQKYKVHYTNFSTRCRGESIPNPTGFTYTEGFSNWAWSLYKLDHVWNEISLARSPSLESLILIGWRFLTVWPSNLSLYSLPNLVSRHLLIPFHTFFFSFFLHNLSWVLLAFFFQIQSLARSLALWRKREIIKPKAV
jgi:hypothetical protein